MRAFNPYFYEIPRAPPAEAFYGTGIELDTESLQTWQIGDPLPPPPQEMLYPTLVIENPSNHSGGAAPIMIGRRQLGGMDPSHDIGPGSPSRHGHDHAGKLEPTSTTTTTATTKTKKKKKRSKLQP